MQASWVRYVRIGNIHDELENNTHVDYFRVLHVSGVLQSTTIHMHRFTDARVHNYLLKCSGCYTCESGTCMFSAAFKQYCSYTQLHS